MIIDGPIRLYSVLEHSNPEHVLSVQKVMAQFWMKYRLADGCSLSTVPEMPRPCTDVLCAFREEQHEDKKYGHWRRNKSLPNNVKEY